MARKTYLTKFRMTLEKIELVSRRCRDLLAGKSQRHSDPSSTSEKVVRELLRKCNQVSEAFISESCSR